MRTVLVKDQPAVMLQTMHVCHLAKPCSDTAQFLWYVVSYTNTAA